MHKAGEKKMMWMGVALLIVGILIYLSNYEYLTQNFWKWLLPLLLVVMGLKMTLMKGMHHEEMPMNQKHEEQQQTA